MTIAPTHDRPHARCTVKFVRMSASKVRVVMDLIRGEHVVDAIETLALSPRLASQDIAKALRSAVANANHNEEIPTEELFVSACYADEGPTLKRFRPRARGRAGKIMKRTCHITVEVARLTDEEISRRNARLEAKGGGAAKKPTADRSKRVAKSKAADDVVEAEETSTTEGADVAATAASAAVVDEVATKEETATEAEETAAEAEETAPAETEAKEAKEAEAKEAKAKKAEAKKADAEAAKAEEPASEAKSETIDSDDDGEVNATDSSPYGDGSHALVDDDPSKMPEGFEIKGNASSKLYHVPGSSFYNRTNAEVWFASTEAAEAAGFELPPSQREDNK